MEMLWELNGFLYITHWKEAGTQKALSTVASIHATVLLQDAEKESQSYDFCKIMPYKFRDMFYIPEFLKFQLDALFVYIFICLKSPMESQLSGLYVLNKIWMLAEAFNYRGSFRVFIYSLHVFRSTLLNVFSPPWRPFKVTCTWQASLKVKQF